MKRRIFNYFILLSAALVSVAGLHAQDTTNVGEDLKNAAEKTGKAVKKGARKAGEKTAEIASKAKSAVVDRVHDSKVGPNGETIFIDGDAKYYYVNKQGRKKYVKERRLKDKS